FGDQDVYLNVAGGLRINEPAADLAAAAALISSAMDMPLPQGCVVFGEISLSGELRAVGRAEARLREAQKLGFDQALSPVLTVKDKGVKITAISRLSEAVERISQNRY
ncbi:MAG: magnesium chelatase domain-containing protein, partial [Brevundimonas sp.]|nr:magnesium chelatase domain-containing protein [Brevundimonas sp.]